MIINIYDNIERIRDEWRDLQEKGQCFIFQQYEWADTYLKTIGKANKEKPFIITFRNNELNSPLIIIPLSIYNRYGMRYLVTLGNQHADFSAVVAANNYTEFISSDAVIELVTKCAKQNGVDIIRIRKIIRSIEGIPNPLYSSSVSLKEEDINYSISLDDSWPDYYKSRKSKLKSDSKRRINLISKQGELQFIVAKTENEMISLTNEMIRQKEQRYEVKKIRNQFINKENINFYNSSCLQQSKGVLHISALTLNNQIIATHWGAVYKKRFYHIMPAHDKDWSKYSPGKILLQKLIEWCCANKLYCFDFTCGGEEYKTYWATKNQSLYEYKRILSLKAKFILSIFRGLDIMKNLIGAFRAKL